jgi:sporulation protein YlmC with PRC-barrel domain
MKKTLTALSVLVLLSVSAAAQKAADTSSPTPPKFVTEQTSSEILASDFTGSPVITSDGKQVGIVKNLVFDENGRISLAVIGVGGFMGVGGKDIATPFESLKPDTRDGKQVLAINATQDELNAAPIYKTLNDKRFAERYAAWKEKAKDGWSKLSEQAQVAYDKAKTAMSSSTEEASQPAQPPATKAE